MENPFFYIGDVNNQDVLVLDENTSRYIVQVLRMKESELVNLTDGKGNLFTSEITGAHKKHCEVKIVNSRFPPHDSRTVTIAISLIKNSSRFEWFLEKATELGINEIIPLVCERTEKEKFRRERLTGIMISAMLQSKQCWLPSLHEPVGFKKVVEGSHHQQKFIAHCIGDEKRNLADLINETLSSQIILIGPEGDFTPEEIQWAIRHHFDAVSLGDTRLRVETAGLVAATLLRLP